MKVSDGKLSRGDMDLILVTYPDRVADALENYKKASLERERIEAKTYLTLKANSAGTKITETHLENIVIDDEAVYTAKLDEIKAEATYQRELETLLCTKRLAGIREAF